MHAASSTTTSTPTASAPVTGQWRWYQERGRIVERHADGRPMRMVGTQTDISAQREQEQAASAAAARLERLALHVPGILYQFELDADFVPRFPYLSDRARTLFGLAQRWRR